MKYLLLLIFFCHIGLHAAIDPITVAKITIEVGARQTEDVFYGFAKGDILIFSLEEVNGKKLREIEVFENSTNIIFSDINVSTVNDVRINVQSETVYGFKLRNSALGRRACRLTIQRIPQSEELIRFNTNWEWREVFDTTYVPITEKKLVGYDTIRTPFTKKELVSVDTVYHEIKSNETITRLRSRTHSSCFGNAASCTKNITVLNYPQNTEALIVWVGVGQNTHNQYDDLIKLASKKAINLGLGYLSGGASLLASSFTDPLIDKAIGNIKPSKSVIDIYFTNKERSSFWYSDMNNSISTYKGLSFKNKSAFKHTITKGNLPPKNMYLCMKNNSTRTGVDIRMNIVAITLKKKYEDKKFIRQEVKPRFKTVHKTEMEVQKQSVRVNAEY